MGNGIVWFSSAHIQDKSSKRNYFGDFAISICQSTHNKYLIKFNEGFSDIFGGKKIQFAIDGDKLLIKTAEIGLSMPRRKIISTYLSKDDSNAQLVDFLGRYKLSYDNKMHFYYAERIE